MAFANFALSLPTKIRMHSHVSLTIHYTRI